MIGTILDLDSDVFIALLTFYLPVVVIALLAGGAVVGWRSGHSASRRVGSYLFAVDWQHSWLRHSPLTPLLFLGAVVLPFLDIGFVFSVVVLALLILPAAFVTSTLFYYIRQISEIDDPIAPSALRQADWWNIRLIALAYLLSGFFAEALVPDGYEYVTDLMRDLPVGLLLGLAGGVVLGIMLGVGRDRLVATLERRHNQGQYSAWVDGSLGRLQMIIEAVLTQFHATALTGVLIISAAALPFSELPKSGMLALFVLVPVMSAVIASFLVDAPGPDQPGCCEQWRTGLWAIAQISVGYIVGAAMLSPLSLVHTWMLDEPDQVIEALKTHLDLTFTALGYSILIGGVGGILASRLALLRALLINLGNVGRTIPSLAVLALALPIFGVGRAPSLIALVFIGALPILVNTSVGIIEVSRDVKEAARGMGMNDLQVLLRVEIPIAMPVIMAGVRTSAVLVVASAVLAGFIGGGGLGDLIVRGDGSGRDDILLTGAILATMLSVFLEYFFGWLEGLLTPRGLREA